MNIEQQKFLAGHFIYRQNEGIITIEKLTTFLNVATTSIRSWSYRYLGDSYVKNSKGKRILYTPMQIIVFSILAEMTNFGIFFHKDKVIKTDEGNEQVVSLVIEHLKNRCLEYMNNIVNNTQNTLPKYSILYGLSSDNIFFKDSNDLVDINKEYGHIFLVFDIEKICANILNCIG